jgi:hypothetical protein
MFDKRGFTATQKTSDDNRWNALLLHGLKLDT